jgi:hypothetical protein
VVSTVGASWKVTCFTDLSKELKVQALVYHALLCQKLGRGLLLGSTTSFVGLSLLYGIQNRSKQGTLVDKVQVSSAIITIHVHYRCALSTYILIQQDINVPHIAAQYHH